jgi:small subunit ribosomal protein S9
MSAEMHQQSNVFWGTGKRKTSVARVRMRPGEGEFVVNDRPADEYFGRESSRMIIRQPFEVTSTAGQYSIDVNVFGGGVSAQAVAIRHGVTRALLQIDAEYRPALKKAGFITRDSREVERKKYGRHKARKRPQYSKR